MLCWPLQVQKVDSKTWQACNIFVVATHHHIETILEFLLSAMDKDNFGNFRFFEHHFVKIEYGKFCKRWTFNCGTTMWARKLLIGEVNWELNWRRPKGKVKYFYRCKFKHWHPLFSKDVINSLTVIVVDSARKKKLKENHKVKSSTFCCFIALLPNKILCFIKLQTLP